MPKWVCDLYINALLMGKGGLRLHVLSGHWLYGTGCWLYLLSMKLSMYGTLSLHISTSLGVSIHGLSSKKRIGQVTSDLLYMIFIYYTKDNQQGSSRLSNWLSLRCLGPWMNHLPPVWWSTFRCQLVWMFDLWWKGIFILISCLLCVFKKITQILLIFYPLKLV